MKQSSVFALPSLGSWLSTMTVSSVERWRRDLPTRNAILFALHAAILVASFPLLGGVMLLLRSPWEFPTLITASDLFTVQARDILRIYALTVGGLFLSAFWLARRNVSWLRHEYQPYYRVLSIVLVLSAIIAVLPLHLLTRNTLVFCLAVHAALWPLHRRPHDHHRQHSRTYLQMDAGLVSSAVIIALFGWSHSAWPSPVAVGTLLLSGMLLWILPRLPSWKWAPMVGMVVFLFWLTFLTETPTNLLGFRYHYGFVLGPVEQSMYGHRHALSNLHAEYGSGLTVALGWYFRMLGFVSHEGLLILLKALTFVQFVIAYILAWSLTRNRTVAFLGIGAAALFLFFYHGVIFYGTPSRSFLQHGFIYLVLLCLTLGHHKIWSMRKMNAVLIPILLVLATAWSVEAAVYAVVPTLVAAAVLRPRQAFVKLLLTYIGMLVLGITLYVASLWLRGMPINLGLYNEFAVLISSGYALVPMHREALMFWILLPVVYLVFAVRMAVEAKDDERIGMLAVYGLCTLMYYVTKAYTFHLVFIMLPFTLLVLYAIGRLHEPMRRMVLPLWCALLLSMIPFYEKDYESIRLFSSHDLNFINPWSSERAWNWERFEQIYCEEQGVASLSTYVENGQLPLLSVRDDAHLIFACLKAANTFDANPYAAMFISAASSETAMQRASADDVRTLLIQDSKDASEERNSFNLRLLLEYIPSKMKLEHETVVSVYGDPVHIFRVIEPFSINRPSIVDHFDELLRYDVADDKVVERIKADIMAVLPLPDSMRSRPILLTVNTDEKKMVSVDVIDRDTEITFAHLQIDVWRGVLLEQAVFPKALDRIRRASPR